MVSETWAGSKSEAIPGGGRDELWEHEAHHVVPQATALRFYSNDSVMQSHRTSSRQEPGLPHAQWTNSPRLHGRDGIMRGGRFPLMMTVTC